MKSTDINVGAFEAKTKLSALLERARRGASITITRHDKPIARLVAYEDSVIEARVNATATLRKLRTRYQPSTNFRLTMPPISKSHYGATCH